ncbi:MAG: MmgE/PrpD family protein [Pseudomonadota bacterium]
MTDALVKRIMALGIEDLDPEARANAAKFFADTLVTGVAGTSNRASERVKLATQSWDNGAKGSCAVLGRPGLKLSSHSAAVLNGFQIHCLEWDALHEPSVVIAACVPLAAIISEAQMLDATFEDTLFAFAVAVEIAVLFGSAAQSGPRFFRPSVAGLMGAAVAVGLLRNFDDLAMTRLLGLAYSQVSGTMQAHWEGAEALPLQIGIAARAALTAADMAEHNITAPLDILDGRFGYFTLIEAGGDPAPLIDKIAKPWKINEVAHKPYPAGRATQTTLTALKEIMAEEAFAMDDVVKVTAHVPPLIMLLVGRPFEIDMEAAYARLCLAYVVPQMIRHGRIDPRLFTQDHFETDQAVADAAKVFVELDGNPDPNTLGPQRIVLELSDGRVLERSVDAPFGSPALPMSREDQIAKAEFCFEVAQFSGDPSEVYRAVEKADSQTRFVDILSLVTGQGGAKS